MGIDLRFRLFSLLIFFYLINFCAPKKGVGYPQRQFRCGGDTIGDTLSREGSGVW